MNVHACYGGTFDPVHNGHLAIAGAVADALGSPVHLLPSADPPHRPRPGASAEQRLAMLELAVAGDPRLRVDARELARPGRSYSIDTLQHLRDELGPEVPLVWVIGGDSLLQLDTWKDWRRIFQLAHVLAVPRPGLLLSRDEIERGAPDVNGEISARWRMASELRQRPSGFFALLPLRALRMESATEVRRRIAAREPWAALVAPAVADYIRGHGLYGADGTAAGQGV